MQEEENTIIDQSADTSEAISSSEEPQSTQAETTRLDAAEAIPSSAADPTAGSGGTDEANAADTAADERSTRTLKLNRNGAEHSEDSSAGGSEESAEARDSEPSSTGEEGEGQSGGRNRRNRNRRNNRREPHVPSENPLSLTELKTKSTQELIDMAADMSIENVARSRKQDIIFSILKRHAKSGEDIYGDGVLEILSDGFGFLRSADSSFLAGPDDIYVSPSQIRRFNLRTGDTVTGMIRPPKDSERYFALLKVSEVNFESPETAKAKILFENLTPLFPDERLTLEKGNGSSEDLTGRIIDLCAPTGKGQRGLLVAPPKAGKTIMMQSMAQAIISNNPECYIIVLLIDERPEEVTEMQRSVGARGAEVVASTFDEPPCSYFPLYIFFERDGSACIIMNS